MGTHFSFLLAAIALLPLLPAADEPQQILLHQGPDVTTPGLKPKEELTYRKEFFVDASLLGKQKHLSLPPFDQLPLSAEKAIGLARATVETRDANGEINVMRLELLAYPDSSASLRQENRILYYFIEFIASGNQVHRVVLMDGTVIKSTLRELKKP